jgi:hypothetical protein
MVRGHPLIWTGLLGLAAALEAIGPRVDGPPRDGQIGAAGAIPRLRIELARDAMEGLRRAPREFVVGTVFEGGTHYPRAAIRLKGSVGSFRDIDDRPSFTLDFCRYGVGPKFHGLRRIHLNNSVEDPSYANEVLGSELFRAAGVPAPWVTRAVVTLNGRDLGVYVLKEGFTEDFLASHFMRVGGELYEPEDGQDIDGRLDLKSVLAPRGDGLAPSPPAQEPPAKSEYIFSQTLRRLVEATRITDAAQRWRGLESALDMDRFMAFMAMEIMLGHRDGYCLARNNFRIYHDPDTDKIIMLPHGMDQLLGTADLSWQPNLAGSIAQAIMTTAEGRRRYTATFRCLFTNIFKAEVLTNRVAQLALELRPFLSRRDRARLTAETGLVIQRIQERKSSLATQLGAKPVEPLEFRDGTVRLEHWVAGGVSLRGALRQECEGGRPMLRLVAGSDTSASWIARAWLKQGRYRFEGQGRVFGVKPLPYGIHHGAGLRVRGAQRSGASLTGDTAWQPLAAEFEVLAPLQEVEFICELRAQAGEAWFDPATLRVAQRETP